MRVVMITAIGVGGATIVGSLIGFFFHDVSHKVNGGCGNWFDSAGYKYGG